MTYGCMLQTRHVAAGIHVQNVVLLQKSINIDVMRLLRFCRLKQLILALMEDISPSKNILFSKPSRTIMLQRKAIPFDDLYKQTFSLKHQGKAHDN